MPVPRRSDAHLRIAHSIVEQLFIRNFSECELAACLFILRLSWGCGKEWAHIPHLADFETAGVYRCDVKDILEVLHVESVIYWNKETNHFAFNKMFDQWNISYRKPSVKKLDKLPELVHHNMPGGAPEPPQSFKEMLANHIRPVCNFPTPPEHNEDAEIISDVCKNHTNNHSFVCNLQTEVVSEPDTAKESILKKEKKEPLPTTTPVISGAAAGENTKKTVDDPEPTKTWDPISKNFGKACTIYEQNIGMLTPFIAQEIDELCTTYEIHWIEEATKEAVRCNRRHLKYVSAILERWGRDGYKTPLPSKFEGIPGRPPKHRLPTGDELEQAWKGKGVSQ